MTAMANQASFNYLALYQSVAQPFNDDRMINECYTGIFYLKI